jgi:DNA-directed RNA polymerase specialized sigma24 family protein
MPSPSTDPIHDDDDALAAALADAWIDEAACNPVKRREALRAAGLLPELEQMTFAELARLCGISEGTVCNMVRMFKSRLAKEILNDPATPRNLISAANAFLSTL